MFALFIKYTNVSSVIRTCQYVICRMTRFHVNVRCTTTNSIQFKSIQVNSMVSIVSIVSTVSNHFLAVVQILQMVVNFVDPYVSIWYQ